MTLEQRLVGDVIAPDIALPCAQIGIERTEQLPRPAHRPVEVGDAPADALVRCVGDRAIELGGGGQQHFERLLVVHVRIAFHHQRQGAGRVRRRHRGAGLDRITAAGNGAVDLRPRCGDAPVFGDAALVVFLLIALIEPGHRQPVTFQIRLKVRQRRAYAGIRVAAVAGAENVDHTAPGNIGSGVEPGALVPVLRVGGVQIRESAIADIRRLTAPTVVDRPHPGIGEAVVDRFEITRIRAWTEEETVVLVGVADKDLRVVSHAVHAAAVTGCAHGADHVGAVGIVVGVERAVDVER